VIGMGLTWGNLNRLRQGRPIVARIADWYEGWPFEILIVAGETAEAIETDLLRESGGAAKLLEAAPLSDAEGALREIRRLALDLESPGCDPAVAAIASEIRARVRHALGEKT
jgi:hypothetical protein